MGEIIVGCTHLRGLVQKEHERRKTTAATNAYLNNI